jgi:hypothetical protein
MLRLNTQDSTFITLRTAAIALLMLNCSASGEPVAGQGGSTSSGGANTSGTSNGSGGTSTGFGGTSNGFGGATQGSGGASMGGSNTAMGGAAAKGGSTGTGGTTTANGGTTAANGGTTTGSGGATVGNGGTVATGSGGATTSTCTAYAGTVGKDSTIFKDGFGTSTSGKWTGYLFSYPYGTATIAPNSKVGTGCFHMAKACVAGTVPADYDSGAALGWNIGQASGASTNTAAALTGSVKVTVAGAVAGMRVNLTPGDSTAMNYCYTLTATDATAIASGLTLPVSSFQQQCYDTAKAMPYTNAPIGSIQVEMPGDKAGAKSFDFCVIDIEPG